MYDDYFTKLLFVYCPKIWPVLTFLASSYLKQGQRIHLCEVGGDPQTDREDYISPNDRVIMRVMAEGTYSFMWTPSDGEGLVYFISAKFYLWWR
jgi:hypothetical protein